MATPRAPRTIGDKHMRQRNKTTSWESPERRGSVVVLTVILMIGMIGLLAFALDMGFICNSRAQLQRSADAAALAATWRLLEDQIQTLGEISPDDATDHARTEGVTYAGLNQVSLRSPSLGSQDVLVGTYVTDESGNAYVLQDPSVAYNTVRVNVQRTAAQNGEVQLFFARFLGVNQIGLECQATAAFWSNFRGFQTPSDGSNLEIMPLALDRLTWEDGVLDGNGTDDYSWDPETKTITAGSDGIPEVNLYPQGTGSPGNRGTVDIGSSGNSTNDLKRQILDGISPSDLSYHGGKLELDANGELSLNADTGISAAIKAELDEIKGMPRIIPIFDSIEGNGNNANYTITSFAGVRIMNVKLTGAMNGKRVIVQPAAMKIRGGIRDNSGQAPSHFIYSPVVLVQ